MAYEDFLADYTEYDPNSKITVTQYECSAVDLGRDNDGRVHDDKGSGHFTGTFSNSHLFECGATTSTGSYGHLVVYMLANAVGDAYDLESGSETFFVIYLWEYGDEYRLIIELYESGSMVSSDYTVISEGTNYFVETQRSSYDFTVVVRTGSHGGSTVATLTAAASGESPDFQYYYPMTGYNTGSTAEVRGYSKNHDLQEGAATLEASTYDSTSVTEDVSAEITPYKASVYDSVSLTDAVNAALTLYEVSVYDSVSVTDELSAALTLYEVSVYDDVSVTDAVSVSTNILEVLVYDDVSVTDSPSAALTLFLVSVYDSVSVTDSATAAFNLFLISVYDSVSVTDAVNGAVTLVVLVYDDVSVTDVAFSSLSLAVLVYDTVSVIDSVDVFTLSLQSLLARIIVLEATMSEIGDMVEAIYNKLPTNYIMGSSDVDNHDTDIDSILVDTGTTIPALLATIAGSTGKVLNVYGSTKKTITGGSNVGIVEDEKL